VKENPELDGRFEAELDAALRHAPESHVPRNFRQRLMARVPEMPTAELPRTWRLPLLAAFVVVILGALALWAVRLGLAGWLAQPSMLLAVLVVESAIAVVWLWRTLVSG